MGAKLKFLKTHEWVRIEGAEAVVGISEYAQDALGDITFVELPKTGAKVVRGKECGVIESVKAASDLYAPVSGEVAEVNARIETEPELINKDPLGEGWLYKLKGVNVAEAEGLMDEAAYGKFLESSK
jgi:glycine cleavage system H protein